LRLLNNRTILAGASLVPHQGRIYGLTSYTGCTINFFDFVGPSRPLKTVSDFLSPGFLLPNIQRTLRVRLGHHQVGDRQSRLLQQRAVTLLDGDSDLALP
jgi:hypothetical protein